MLTDEYRYATAISLLTASALEYLARLITLAERMTEHDFEDYISRTLGQSVQSGCKDHVLSLDLSFSLISDS